MKAAERARRRLHTQRLAGGRFAAPADAVRFLTAVQSQDYPGAKWGLAQRSRAVGDAALDRQFDAGVFLRTHVLRPTWHFVAPEDIRWLLELTAPRVKAQIRGTDRRIGLDGPLVAQMLDVVVRALAGNAYKTRPELGAALERHGLPDRGQVLAHALSHAELDGLVCSGPRRGKQHTYALLDERAPGGRLLGRDEALAELALRYFTSHGPATAEDFAWWAGLTLGDVRRGLHEVENELGRADVEGRQHWFRETRLPQGPDAPTVHLLPNYDEYLIAYKGYGRLLDPVRLTVSTNALISHLVVLDGEVIGGWKRSIGRDAVSLTTNLARRLTGASRRALEDAARAYGRFLALPVLLDGTLLD